MWMVRALWLVVAHDLSEYGYMDDVTRSLVCLFCSTWRAVLKMFVRLFRIKQVKSSNKVQQKLFTRNKNGETGTKRALEYLRIPKPSRNLHNSCHRESSLRETRCFAKCFRHYSALCKKRSWKLNFSKKLYTSKIKRKRRSRDEK